MAKKQGAAHSTDATEQSSARAPFPIIGLGASAGGLEALKSFFENVPAGSGMAYVVVVHLAPDQPTAMPELIGRVAPIPVTQAEDGQALEPNHVFIAPPGTELQIYAGRIQLLDRSESHPNLAIDPFLRSLAADQGANAGAVILSGTGTDGSGGIKDIKASEGLVLVQTAATAGHGGMPRSAMFTGVADMELDPADMPPVIGQHFRHGPPARGTEHAVSVDESDERWLSKVFAVVRSQMEHDFAAYKRTTLLRRIRRRMALHEIDNADDYVQLLRHDSTEVETLFREFLIGVTHFFRDAESFETLRDKALVPLLRETPPETTLRVWVPGCSTGEEAYSLAMVIHEAIDELPEKRLSYQIFGTDIESRAVQKARMGVFPQSIAADVPEARLRRFFVKEGDTYRVRKELRESVVFSVQDVLKDPPFSRLNILCCRNLLIYLEKREQERLLRLFHYTLQPDGILMLGSSETIGGFTRLYATVDNHWKIYRRREVPDSVRGPISFPTGNSVERPGSAEAPRRREQPKANVGALAQQALLSNYAPNAVLVDAEGNIIHVLGHTGRYLEAVTGPATHNAVDMARQGLRLELSTALRAAQSADEEVIRHGVRVQANGESVTIDLHVKPLKEPSELQGRFLVVFNEIPDRWVQEPGEAAATDVPEEERASRIAELERELQETRASHQTTVEELEAANEELHSANEEMHSSNEELQSTNEELESSKEELQSLNEELNTVNSELQSKVEELAAAHDDMRNLLNSTDVASIFVDGELNIRRFTDRATDVANLIETDVGRPLQHVSMKLEYQSLHDDVEAVVDELQPITREVQTTGGSWYEVRITPYRTTDNRIDGAVLTFVDISAQKEIQERLEELNDEKDRALELARRVVDMNPEPLVVLDEERRISLVNEAFCKVVGATKEGLSGADLFAMESDVGTSELEERLTAAVEEGRDFGPVEITVTRADRRPAYSVEGRIVTRSEGLPYRILLHFAQNEPEESGNSG